MSHGACNEPGDWRDSPFFTVIYDYTVKNAGLPTDMGTLIAYILLLVATWYVFIWIARFLLSLMWPVIIVVTALFLIRFLRTFQPEDLQDMVVQTLTFLSDIVLKIMEKTLEYLTGLLE